MTLKKRFSILLCLVILAMVITNIVSQVNIKTLLQLEEQHQTLEKIKSAMLMLRRNEKDFILRQDPKYLAEFDKNNQVLGKLLDDFTIRLEQVDMSSESVRSLKEALSTYESNFHSYALTSQQIGLSPELGLYGNLRKSVHEVETLVSDQDDRLLADMLMLRRNEKDFMLRKDIKYLDKFNTNLTKFETDLSSSYISADLKQSISQALSVYQKEFLLFVAGQQKLGLSPDQNIQGAMRASVHKSEVLIEELYSVISTAIQDKTNDVRIFSALIGLALTLLIGFVVYLLSKAILGPVQSFSKIMNDSANNRNLTIRSNIQDNSEIGQMGIVFNNMMEAFQTMFNQVATSSTKVQSASEILKTVIDATLSAVSKQHSESEMVATAMTEMASSVNEVARSAALAAEASNKADAEADAGNKVVFASVEGIELLAREVENAVSTVNELKQESENIATVLTVITGIAEQTNLLALNAAIEAARAGEKGRGFAVVADEVRTLAQRSQEATGEIKTIIERLQLSASSAVNVMAEGKIKAKESVVLAQQAGSSLKNIVISIATIRDMNTQIASAAEQQAAVAESINKSIVQISQIAEENTENAEKTSLTSGELAELANQLQVKVKEFTY